MNEKIKKLNEENVGLKEKVVTKATSRNFRLELEKAEK